jgi:flagella basal body P-ring formation protein FlgA
MNFRFTLGLGVWAMAANVAAAQPPFQADPTESLARVAERFTEQDQHYASDSVHAVAIDRRVKLGECASGFEYKFPFGVKTTLEILCPDNPNAHRYVTMDLPRIAPTSPLPGRSPATSPSPLLGGAMWVAARDLPFGTVLAAGDLTQSSKDQQPVQGLGGPTDLLGGTLVRQIPAGSVVGRADIRPTLIIKRQMPVMAYSEFAGGQISSKMVALQAGAAGDFIELENAQSGRKRYGQIQSDGTVRLGGPEIQKNIMAGVKVTP